MARVIRVLISEGANIEERMNEERQEGRLCFSPPGYCIMTVSQRKEGRTDKGEIKHGNIVNEDSNGGGCTAIHTRHILAIMDRLWRPNIQLHHFRQRITTIPQELEYHWNPLD